MCSAVCLGNQSVAMFHCAVSDTRDEGAALCATDVRVTKHRVGDRVVVQVVGRVHLEAVARKVVCLKGTALSVALPLPRRAHTRSCRGAE